MFEDRPNYWDAWGALCAFEMTFYVLMQEPLPDVEIHHLEKATPIKFTDISVVSEGPLRAAVKSVVKYGKSTITVTVRTICCSMADIKLIWPP